MTRRTIRTAATSSLALAVALAAAPAAAQSFQGTPTVTFGSATVTEGTGTTDVAVNSSSAVIDWTPDDTAINNGVPILFQPAGTTATYAGAADFAVLNRIVPTDISRAIIFDGTVLSRVAGLSGGTVFFYSPGGVIIGANAFFDVGNLGLTTAEPVVDGNGNWYTGNQVQFQQAASSSFIDIQQGAQISALSEGSYIAAFAPHIVQDGTINVNGQAALVAAEAGTITFSPDGLFDIAVTIGTDGQGGFGISHSGTTTGPASSGPGDNHRIYMVAIPKNSLLTLGIERGSEIGFDIAGAADTVGNAVILSAGRSVVGDAFVSASRVAGGNITINDSNTGNPGTGIDFTSQVTAVASDTVQMNVFRQTNFASNAFLIADNLAQAAVGAIPADSTGSLTVGGNFVLDTDFGNFAGATEDSGMSLLFASDGGSIDVAGDLTVRAAGVNDRNGDGVVEGGTAQINLSGGTADVGGTVLVQSLGFNESGADVIGGNSQVNLFGASGMTVGGVLRIDSNGIAGSNNGQMGAGGDGTGGFSGLLVAEGSTLTTNELNIAADGVGGADAGAGGGAGTGGGAVISVADVGSAMTVQSVNSTGVFANGELDLLSAEGFGGTTAIAGSVGGSAQGGNAHISVTNGGTLALPSATGIGGVRVIGRATGGSASADGATGGNAAGGTVSVFLDNGTLTGDGFLFSSFAQGGNAATGATGTINGGDATGGNRVITIQNGSSFSGSATGGPGAVGGNGTATGTGGDGTGGSATLLVDNSILNVSALGFNSFTQNFAGSGGVGGNASGGTSFAQISNGAVVNLVAGSSLSVSSNNFAEAFAEESDATGGNVTGGNATLLVENATITGPGTVEVSAGGTGGSVLQGQGGNGTGGTAHLQLRGATINVSDIVLDASGNGGSADPALLVPPPATVGAGNGGNGTGGLALITAESGVSTVTTNFIDADADGNGGTAAGSSGNGGLGTGGQARLAVDAGATLAVNGSVALSADAEGGVAGTFDPLTGEFNGIGTGGDAFGGNAQVAAINGSLTVTGDVEVEGEADGGGGITGGNGTAGSFVVIGNGGSIAIAGDLDIEAGAYGGDGTITGGNATGSLDSLTTVNAFLYAQNGGSVSVGGTASLATEIQGGAGGNGGNGGDATGGATLVLAQTNTASSVPSTITLNDVFALAIGTGGDGGSVASGSGTTGGAGGNGQAGQVLVLGDAGNGQITINGTVIAAATGEGGTGGDGDIGGRGGTGFGGNIQIGTRSGQATANNDGSASFTDITAIVSGLGGDGGQGLTGAGGIGGEGSSGAATLLVRGSPVTVSGTAQLQAIGTGGNGGAGATVVGDGGDGRIDGGVAVLVTNRFQIPGDRGTLTANTISAQAIAQEGIGATNGTAFQSTQGALVEFVSSDATIGTLDVSVSADVVEATTPDLIHLLDATVSIGDFSLVTPNDLVLDLDSATLTTANYLTDSRSIQLPATAPAVAGTVVATNSFAIFTQLGFDTLTYVNFDVAGGINFNNPGNFQTGDLTADGDIIMTTVGNLVTGDLASTGQILLTTNGNQTVGNVTSGGATNFNVDGALIAGQVQTGGGFTTLVDGNQTIGNVVAGDSVDIRGGANISVGSIMGAASVYVISTGGVVTTGAIDAGDPALTDGKRFGIALRGSSLSTGNLATQGPIIAAAESGTMTVGNVSSGSSILLLGAGNIATGSVAGGTDPGETFYVGGVDNLARLGAGDDFQPIIAVDPSPTGGSVTLGGPVSADRVLVAAGGTAAINGMVTAPFVQFVSGDIAIGTSGGIDTGTGQVRLVSSNASGMFVGDGGSGGYTLDNAEFSRVRGSEIFIAGVDGSSPIDMTIGNLSISGSQTGPDGTVVFATGDLATMTSSGGIRVNGEVVATNQTANNYLEFYAALIEVNAQIGGIRSYSGTAPTGTGNPGVNALGGIVVLEANNVHVASDTILQKLRADPFYSGHAAELNQPGAINRPNGALTALGIEFYPGETLYIQNTGTADNPAGFYATLENSDIDPFVYEGNGTATPQVEVVINGSFASPNGDVSGQPAYQLIIDNAESLDGFSGASQVNGCSFDTGACGPVVVGPGEESPSPTNTSEIAALTQDQAEEEPFDTDEDDEEAEQAASSPIAPPVVLINTSPLNPDVDVTDPVSGTGNPALIGASISQPSQGDQQ